MARPKIKTAMRARGYNYRSFATEMGVTPGTVFNWLSGKTEVIWSEYVPSICDKLGLSLEDLENEPGILHTDQCESNEKSEVLVLDCQEEEDPMELSRRKAAITLLEAAGITFIPGTTIPNAPIVGPEITLAQCTAVVNAAWKFLQQADYNGVEELLNPHESTLIQLASTDSPHQQLAAKLAVQTRLMQMHLATNKLNYLRRESLGLSAIRFAQIAGDKSALAASQYWHGDTYVYCDRLPETAIPILNKALSGLPSGAPLRSTIYIDLAIAHTQYEDKTKKKENETKAIEYIKKAWETLPEHPETDPLYRWLTLLGTSELNQLEGKVYLHLAELFPKSRYALQAYEKFDLSTSKQAISVSMQVQCLIRKAHASIALGDMNHFVDCLTDGLVIAIKIDSLSKITQAHEVISGIPKEWQKEATVVDLQKEISQRLPKDTSRAIVVARR